MSTSPILTDPNLVDAQAKLLLAQGTIDSLNAVSASDAAQIQSLMQQVADLQAELKAAGGSEELALTRAIVHTKLQAGNGWALMPGTKANSGQTGSTGTGDFNPGDVATLTCMPNGPWYDAGFSLDMGAYPNPDAGVCRYRGSWMLDEANLSKAHQLELDACVYDGAHRWHPAVAVNMTNKTLSFYDPAQGWVNTGIAAPMTAGQFLSVEVIGRVDIAGQKFQYFGFRLNDVFHPFSATPAANPNTFTAKVKPIIQIDSGKAGAKFQAQIKDVSLVWE